MRFAIYSEREQRRRDDRQTMDGGQVRIPRRRAEYEYRCRSRTAFSPAGSVRVGYGLPSAGHSLPSALRCPKFLARCRSRNFDRCTFRASPSSATGGGRLSERYLHQFRLAASDVSARCRLAVPEISLLAAASRNFDRCTFHALPSSATGGGKAQNPVQIKTKEHFCEVLTE